MGQRTAVDATLINFAHLDHLLEVVEKEGEEVGIVHIYSEAPEYDWVHDEDEGAACVDDAARAAVLYMRDADLTGNADSRRKAAALLRFVLYMQAENGLFYNFVWNSDLDINRAHPNSQADDFSWWTARSVWALGRCAEVFSGEALGLRCAGAANRTLPHLEPLLKEYGETFEENGRRYPRWLLQETASDATSELLLGLVALGRADSSAGIAGTMNRLADGIEMMQYGRIGEFPFGAHASWIETWHAWGNAQTQALAELASYAGPAVQGRNEVRTNLQPQAAATPGERLQAQPDLGAHPVAGAKPTAAQPDAAGHPILETALHEADQFYPFLLVDGWMHSMNFAEPTQVRQFEQIAYGVRGVALGLLNLYDATGEERFAVMAGLAASWFTGNNVAGAFMYDAGTGRGYDGIGGPDEVNRNAGAESTIEALMTLLDAEHVPAARRWLFARGDRPRTVQRNGKQYRYRVFRLDETADRVGVILNLTDQASMLLEGDALAEFLDE